MLSLEKFIALQESCLKIEREEEIRVGTTNLEHGNFKDLEKRGSALTGLIVQGTRTGLYGRCIVTLVSKRAPLLPSHSMSSGDIVKLIGNTDKNGEGSPSGVITSANTSTISISLDEDSAFEADDQKITIVKVANDVTYKRLKGALSQLSQSSNQSRLESILFGLGEMSSPNVLHSPKLLNSNGELEYFNANLNSGQKSTVDFALLQKEIGVVHGPPGTGKTTTVVEIVSQAVKSGSRVLCTAPSNVAVDNLLERLVKNKLKCVRIGHPARISEELQKYSLDALIDNSDQTQIVRDVRKDIDLALKNPRKNRNEIKELRKECRERENKAMKEIFSRAQVILSTLVSSDPIHGPLKVLKECQKDFFDLVVIDECSQALELSCWIALPQAPKAILSGDHCQLPPTIMSREAVAKGFGNTLMERLVKSHPSAVRILEMQYRMNSLIMNWSSKEFYESKLKAGSEEVAERLLKKLPKVQDNEETSVPIILIDTAGCDCPESVASDGDEETGSKANEGEAALVVAHVRLLIDAGVTPTEIAIITPYNLQVDLIRSQFTGDQRPEVRTVDGFQGQEKEAVILSLVRSNKKGNVGFLAEPRRLNVAVTRAKRHLVVICDSETLSKGDPFLKRFVEYIGEMGEIRSAMEYSTEDIVKYVEKRPQISTSPKKSSVPKSKKRGTNKASQKSQKGPIKEFHLPKETKPQDDEELSEDPRVNEYRSIVQEFMKNKEGVTFSFNSDLNSHERMLIHSLIEREFPSLSHESIGEGKDRQIVLKKKDAVEPKPRTSQSAEVKVNAKNTPKGNMFEGLEDEPCQNQPSEKVKIEKQRCEKCLKDVPVSNLALHEMRCTSEKVKASVKKKTKIPETDDFDEICSAFAKMDAICNAQHCKTKVSTLGMNCMFCRRRFCLSHGMAEIHGCGDEVRKAARKQIAREGKIYPGSGKPDRSLDKVKRSQLAKRLDKKINEKVEERRVKKKEK